MKDSNTRVKLDNPAEEARRYVENAKKAVRENEKYDPETGCYDDPKYIRSAGHYLWHAVLIMLDAVFHVKSIQQIHPDIYGINHITLGYDGVLKKSTFLDGVGLTNDIIDRCERMLPH